MTTAKVKGKAIPARMGRPLSFDRDIALERAMLVFWDLGYDGASIAELTSAMGITAPSLYTAFGDKQRLFLEATQRYLTRPDANLRILLDQSATAFSAVEAMFAAASVQQTRRGKPHGCMVMSASINSPSATEVQTAIRTLRTEVEDWIKTRIDRGVVQGEFSNTVDTAALAAYYMSVLEGISTQARDGASREKLRAISALALSIWPGKPC